MYGGTASRNRTAQDGDRRSQKEETRVSITGIHQRSLHQESLRVLVSERWEW